MPECNQDFYSISILGLSSNISEVSSMLHAPTRAVRRSKLNDIIHVYHYEVNDIILTYYVCYRQMKEVYAGYLNRKEVYAVQRLLVSVVSLIDVFEPLVPRKS